MRLLVLAGAASCVAVGCCSDREGSWRGQRCSPGATHACSCPGGGDGTRTCLEDGVLGPCVCSTAAADPEPAGDPQQRRELEEIEAELALLEKIANESDSQERRAEAMKRMKELRVRLTRAKMIRLSGECVDNPLDPECQ